MSFQNLLKSRNLEKSISPLWKLRITTNEYLDLKHLLYDSFRTEGEMTQLKKEAALFYAEWWRREYNGCSPSKIAVVNSIGIPSAFAEEFYKIAKIGAKSLGIKLVQRNGRKYYFRTLLLQGGLPICYMHNDKNGFNGYKRFLLSLVKEVKLIDVDWNESDFIEKLTCIRYLPDSFNNEGIFELSLQIAHAIVEERNDMLPYDAEDGEWKNFTNELKKEYSRVKRRSPFIVHWELVKKEKVRLYYSIDTAKKIDVINLPNTILKECYSFRLHVQEKYIASYRRMNEDIDENCFFMRMDNRSEKFEWKGESVISIQLVGDNESISEITAPHRFAPDFDIPQIFQKQENKWILKTNGTEVKENALLFSEPWQCKADSSIEKIELNAIQLYWTVFNESITLINKETEEEVVFDNKVSDYSVEFLNWSVEWIHDANYKILTKNPEIRVLDSEHEIVNKKLYKILYRKHHNTEWVEFINFALPIGLLEFKVLLPDGKSENEKFYFTGDLVCKYLNMGTDYGEIEWQWNGGVITLYKATGMLFQKTTDRLFKITREENNREFFEPIQFRLQTVEMPPLNIKIAPPFKGVMLTNQDGKELPDGEIIAQDSLHRFKIIVIGYDNIPIEIFYKKINSEKPETVIIREKIRQGIHSLGLFDEQVQKMFQLYGFNSFDRGSSVGLLFNRGEIRKSIGVRMFDLDSYMDENGLIHIIDCVYKKEKNYLDTLIAVPVNCSFENIKEYELKKTENVFCLPEEVDQDQYILFSNLMAEEKIIPKYFNSKINIEDNRENRHLLKSENIERHILLLIENDVFNGDEWKKVLVYFELVMKYRLPFRTFNCFCAIALKPELLVKMLFSLSLYLDKEKWISGIIKFEKELAVAYHWIKSEIWNTEFWKLFNTVPDISDIRNKTIEVCNVSQKIILETTLNSNISELICFAFQEERCNNVVTLNRPEIQEMRSQILGRAGTNNDLPKCKISNNHRYFSLDGATNYQITCLLSPVKVAETLMGVSDDLWNVDDLTLSMRRIINYYRDYLPDVYYRVLINIVKQIRSTTI